MTSGLEEREFSFVAQLLPIDRGILETIYFRAGWTGSRPNLSGILRKTLRATSHSFVSTMPEYSRTSCRGNAQTSATLARNIDPATRRA